MFVQKSQGQTVFAATHPGKVPLASRHLTQQWKERHLFGFPAEIQCGIFGFQGGVLWLFCRGDEVTTTTDRRWRPHETEHYTVTARERHGWEENARYHGDVG